MTYNVKTCPVTVHAHPLHSQWGMPLLAELTKTPRRFGELKRALHPITSRTLSALLRRTQDTGHVAKQGDKYCLTNTGTHLFTTLKPLTDNTCASCSGCGQCRQ